mgnify:FL=1|tara:strand:- start:1182 stop:1403 length:222 start_codon:yes stop_codon:yes gene_type:complete
MTDKYKLKPKFFCDYPEWIGVAIDPDDYDIHADYGELLLYETGGYCGVYIFKTSPSNIAPEFEEVFELISEEK